MTEPDWSQFSERDLLEFTARNSKRAADTLEKIHYGLNWAVGAAAAGLLILSLPAGKWIGLTGWLFN